MKKLFVYGTLRTDMYNYKKFLKDKILQSELAYVKGSLYEIKGVLYPALIPGDHMIAGEIMEVDDDAIFTTLDELEGYHGEANDANEYDKVMMDIYDDRGEIIDYLPVYVFNTRKEERKKLLSSQILEHDYVAFMAKKGNCRIRLSYQSCQFL